MGCSSSSRYRVAPAEEYDFRWKIKQNIEDARLCYISDTSIAEDCTIDELESRALLDDPISCKCLRDYEYSTTRSTRIMLCWADTQMCKMARPFKRSKVDQLMNKHGRTLELADVMVTSRYREYVESRGECTVEMYETTACLSSASSANRVQIVDLNGHAKASPGHNGPGPVGLPPTAATFAPNTPSRDVQFLHYVQRLCSQLVYTKLFLAFKGSEEYATMCTAMQSLYNTVCANDFEYLGRMAEGGFGLVLCCRKKSTKRIYAMKIQPKYALLRHYRSNPDRVALEVQACTRCANPYITSVDFAFRTQKLAIMVQEMATCGDLRRSLAGGTMASDRVHFYAAEICSALFFLHGHGIIYRDLKPANILLTAEGHILLADFGSLADMNGALIPSSMKGPQSVSHGKSASAQSLNVDEVDNTSARSVCSAAENKKSHIFSAAPLASPAIDCCDSTTPPYNRSESLDESGAPPAIELCSSSSRMRMRTQSIVGTLEYMAPEILVMFGKKKLHAEGYTAAVDWWSLGITLYKLLAGREPYATTTYSALARNLPKVIAHSADFFEAFTEVFGELFFDFEVDPTAESFIRGLLGFEAERRLGSNGIDEIRNHPYFRDVNWDLMEKKQVCPPYHPTYEVLSVVLKNSSKAIIAGGKHTVAQPTADQPLYPDFKSILSAFNKAEWADDAKYIQTSSSHIAQSYKTRSSSSHGGSSQFSSNTLFGKMSIFGESSSSSIVARGESTSNLMRGSNSRLRTNSDRDGSNVVMLQRRSVASPGAEGTSTPASVTPPLAGSASDASKFYVEPEDEYHFRLWDYVSPQAITAEEAVQNARS